MAPEDPDALDAALAAVSLPAAVHEIQNTLTGLSGWVQLARASRSREVHTHALAVVERGLALVASQVAALGEPSERFRVQPVPADVVRILAEVHELLHPRCSARAVELRARLGEAPGALLARADPARLTQVLTNLVLNAVDAILAARAQHPERGVVTLSLGRTPERVGLVIEDDGVGMEGGVLSRIFEPGFTTHPQGGEGRARGRGLGMVIVRRLVEAMEGLVEVASRPGEGTAVTVWLKRETAPGPSPSHPPPAGLRSGLRVLVVDDEPAIRELLEVALTLRGAEVTAVADVDRARRVLARGQTDVMLVDETLGVGVSGTEFMADMAVRFPSVGRVLMTGAPESVASPGLWASLVRKPFLLDDVVRALDGAVVPPEVPPQGP
ncbi:MAG: response regulator [Deltaproteobacteria bacterium]|nr:response regulator [Deltaproteobacteria bacterium]